MNFSVSDSMGFIEVVILFGALMIAFTVAATLIVRLVRGRDDGPVPPDEPAPAADDVG